jgi:hypothetical protein
MHLTKLNPRYGAEMSDILLSIHKAFIGFMKRAEKLSSEILYNTFVDSAPLFELLSTKNNQVMYGRRGTGKTHALKYLARHLQNSSILPIYIDLGSIGSEEALYNDRSKTEAERSVRLILDVLHAIVDELYEIAVSKISDAPHPEQITLRLDDLDAAISEVKIVGDRKLEEKRVQQTDRGAGARGAIALSKDGPNLSAEVFAEKRFSIGKMGGEYIGLELGADISADLKP